MRIRVMPLARRSSMVVMKFSAPISDATQKIAMLMIHRSAPSCSPGPALGKRAQRRVAGPAVQRRAAGDEERGEHDHERDERGPERKHVQDRERHVLRADLDRQEVIAESALRRRGQHEEHHDGAVHGQQAEVGFRLDLAEQRQIRRRPDHVDAHQQRQEHADKHRRERQKVILQPDDFVIQAENVFANEAGRGRVSVNRVRVVSVGVVSVLGNHYCFSASRAASHLSKSSWLTTFSMPCIL